MTLTNAQVALQAAAARSANRTISGYRDSPNEILGAADLFLVWLNRQDDSGGVKSDEGS